MAKTTDWGLTDAGFRRPTYAELLDALEYKARELFGSKANLTVRSPLGIFLRIYAWMLNLLFSTLEDVYNSRFVDTAVCEDCREDYCYCEKCDDLYHCDDMNTVYTPQGELMVCDDCVEDYDRCPHCEELIEMNDDGTCPNCGAVIEEQEAEAV